MNEYQRYLMTKPSIELSTCAFCGRPWNNRHHIVLRSAGGHDGPTVTVCGMGNASGCHGLLHGGYLHLTWSEKAGGWVYLKTRQPVKIEQALRMGGWTPIRKERNDQV